MKPEQAGATSSGVLATAQNVGNALGVAVVGVVFFGALHRGYGDRVRTQPGGLLAGTLAAVALLTRLLPAPVRS